MSVSGLCLVSFVFMTCLISLSCVKVNSMICMVRFGLGIRGRFIPMMLHVCIQCRSFARYSHHLLLHVHLGSLWWDVVALLITMLFVGGGKC